jgi:uncharacterized protein YjdB
MKVRFLLLSLLLTTLLLYNLTAQTASAATCTTAWNNLDYGIYWFGAGNTSQKYVPGVANPYYNPAKPTVIYAHGWQNGSTARMFRESFNYYKNDATYGVDINMADAWINQGWNIGIFYWNQFADEGEVKDAEAKIWTASGPQGMRWRKCDGSYSTAGTTGQSVAELFYNEYVAALASNTSGNIRVAGHSLGSQLATRLTQLVSDNITAGRIAAKLLPKRVALLDPFFSKDGKSYLGGAWVGEKVRAFVGGLSAKGVAFEHYKSSGITDVGVGDKNAALEYLTAFERVQPGWIPWYDLGGKHVAAYNWYFWSFGTNLLPEYQNGTATGNAAASAKTSDARIREMMTIAGQGYEWQQDSGSATQNPADDKFTKRAK